VLVIALSSPVFVGIYDNNKLIYSFKSYEMVSNSLPKIFKKILQSFTCKELFYARGPGSFMAIKASFVYLRSLQIALNVPLFACEGFIFNGNSPIKAFGNQWFVKEKINIVLKENDMTKIEPFKLPNILDRKKFNEDSEPLYVLSVI
jgi:tRNA A37 threonylcarbamoyladenosine modification protein TsaB